jgi:hypothetical protein
MAEEKDKIDYRHETSKLVYSAVVQFLSVLAAALVTLVIATPQKAEPYMPSIFWAVGIAAAFSVLVLSIRMFLLLGKKEEALDRQVKEARQKEFEEHRREHVLASLSCDGIHGRFDFADQFSPDKKFTMVIYEVLYGSNQYPRLENPRCGEKDETRKRCGGGLQEDIQNQAGMTISIVRCSKCGAIAGERTSLASLLSRATNEMVTRTKDIEQRYTQEHHR